MILYRVAFASGITLILLGLTLAVIIDDPYLFRRFGALTTGYAACLVLLQIALENRFETQKEGGISETENDYSPVKQRWLKKLTQNKTIDYAKKRMTIAKIVATLALMGEVVHGFGDYLIKALY